MSQSLSFRFFSPSLLSTRRRPCVPIRAVQSEAKPSKTLVSYPTSSSVVVTPVLPSPPSIWDSSYLEADPVAESEIKENGFGPIRRTKVVCTIGPGTCGLDELEALAAGGMNVARLNLCHNSREWHREVIRRVRRLNEEKGFAVAVMVDTQGSEIHLDDLDGATSSTRAEYGDVWTFSIRSFDSNRPVRTVGVSYDGFAEDVQMGDELLVDGGMVRFEVIEKIGPDVKCQCIDPGLLLPRANLALWRNGRLVRDHTAMLPTITPKDWLDIDFATAEGVDFIALSFVQSAEAINDLRSYIAERSPKSDVAIIAKIESIDSLKNLEGIIKASDGAMVARGDMGSQIPLEHVPLVQEKIVQLCRELNKPVIVASQLLESMIEYPIPTRAEVADVSDAVRQQADVLMLSGESAMGKYPEKALAVLRSVSLRMEKRQRDDTSHEHLILPSIASSSSPGYISEEICNAAAKLADNLKADAIFVYTKDGGMASLLSRCRPDCPIIAFASTPSVRRRLSLHRGVIPFRLNFPEEEEDMETNLSLTFSLLTAREMIQPGNVIVIVSDMLQSVQSSRVNVVDMKALMLKKVGPERFKWYFYSLDRFINEKMSKVEFAQSHNKGQSRGPRKCRHQLNNHG
ncbi:hypothetical protein V2J09_015605 [Rumex salicifolius]